jgi:CDP-diacylglycerol--serine O-phosphatidyltransferase
MSRPKHFSMIREFHLADFFTLGNAACGTLGVFFAMLYMSGLEISDFYWAAVMAPLAFAFDVFDGRIARARQQHSALGRELDSLADVISFGMAPAALGFAVGLRGTLDVAVLLYFVACGISRLARFNATADALADDSGKVPYFEGTPIPTSVLLVGVIAWLVATTRFAGHMWGGQWELGGLTLHPFVLIYALSGSAMISTIRVPKL